MAINSSQLDVVGIFYEDTPTLKEVIQNDSGTALQRQHLSARDQAEVDFFGLYIDCQHSQYDISMSVPRGWFSTAECMDELLMRKAELILVYGTSIIKGPIIHRYKNHILNLHLGLSPYYRGSGTNYFPFVNREPEYCGATYMYLDSGIDTGEIIHQIRPLILSVDSFHQLSNRFLIRAFQAYIIIAANHACLELPSSLSQSYDHNRTRLLYKDKDFTPESVKMLYSNFNSGMLEEYLENFQARVSKVPLVQQKFLQVEGNK
jgi:phosphoribosylglycinamide formyltransferase-1